MTGSVMNSEGAPQAFAYHQGKMQLLGVMPGFAASEGLGINSKGEVVGILSPQREFSQFHTDNPLSTPIHRPFILREGKMRDLNDFIDAHAGWTLQEANGINDKGQIVGTGQHNGKTCAFLLTPKK